jgi:hypothetical protein
VPIITTIRGNLRPFGKRFSPMSGSTGGTITEAGGRRIHSFTATGNSTFTPAVSANVECLIVAGGGGGGSQVGGGGGAGGLIYSSSIAVTAQNYTITVGAGGAGGRAYGPGPEEPGDYGQNSVALGLTAQRGGGGGCHPETKRPISGNDGIAGHTGRPGGSGGGGGGSDGSRNGAGGTGTAGQGNAGGQGLAGTWAGGGGGGAGSAGTNGLSAASGTGGTGGNGLSYSISGTSQFYAAGGGGCWNSPGVTSRANDIGGRGEHNYAFDALRNGNASTGSGGGGVRDVGNAGAGGSGIVIISYPI